MPPFPPTTAPAAGLVILTLGGVTSTAGSTPDGSTGASEAVLIAAEEPDDASLWLRPILASVVQAREARYLMLNAPDSALQEICDLVPGSGAPSVIPLAEPGMVAVHALVPAADVWRLLPQLEAAGASSILLVPVERMLA